MSEHKETTNSDASDKSPLQIRLDLDVVESLDAQAEQKGLSRGEVIEEILARSVARYEAEMEGKQDS